MIPVLQVFNTSVPGAIICVLTALNFDLMMYGMTNWFMNLTVIIVDAAAFGVIGGICGAVAGLVLDSGKKAAA